MKQASSLWQMAGFVLASLGGTLLHFLYDWTGGSILIAPFSGINESTWEHMKLLFYTYNGVFGKSPDWISIAIFYISAGSVFLFERWLFDQNRLQCRCPQLAFSVICLIGALFVVFTFAPPQIPLFRDPLAGTYGIGGQPPFLCLQQRKIKQRVATM